jgi:3-oxoacyl-(acyl-carrier-protein) synthase
VPNVKRETQVDVALSNAMGLGGHNGCVLFGRPD